MLRRPKAGETEEDLLKQEEEFLKESGKTPTQKRNPEDNHDESKSSAVAGIVGEVVERSQGLPCTSNCGNEARGNGFPPLFKIDPTLETDKEGKKSLFALHMEKNKNGHMTMEIDAPRLSVREAGPSQGSSMYYEDTEDTEDVYRSTENRTLSDDAKRSIHEENLNKLSEMSEAEILEVQRKLHQTLDSKLISFLKNRSKPKENEDAGANQEPQEAGMRVSSILFGEGKILETLRRYVGDKWVHMDFIEKEKLEWVGDIPCAEALQANQSYSARFDFKGELQPFRTEIDVRNALYHHGDEPERPGYTIQELYQLARSAVLQQRILALNTLANIIYKAKLGYYDACFDGYLLQKFMDADLFLLLRFSIDENALIPPTIFCLRRLIYNDSDEYCQDRLLGITEEDLQPLLFQKMDVESEEEMELMDNTLIHCDLIKGILRTDLLTRITYILKYLPCERETIANALFCFIRVARHCTESCERLARTPGLLQFVYSTINCDDPFYQSVKLFRLLMGQSKSVAVQIASRYPLGVMVKFLDQESMNLLSKRELFLLKLECIYLWRNCIRCGFMKDDFISWTPCFVRMLRFFVDRVDIYAETDFDFELFAALMSLLRLCVREKLPIDSNYVAMMYVCGEKWMSQLMQSQKFNYSGMKALGSCFAFFVDYFEVFGSDQNALSFIRKLNGMISTLIGTPLFDRMATRLTDYSHLLTAAPLIRDPRNLPSLCSVYENGEDFLRIVNNESTLPFFFPFVKYLQFSYGILNASKCNIEMFVNNTAVRKYVTEVIKLEENSGAWFARYELSLLTHILQLFFIVKDKQTLKFGFRLLPMIRVDEEELVLAMTVVTDRDNWNSMDELFDFLTEIYLNALYRPEVRNGYALRYKHEPVGEDWAYKGLTNLRGRDATMEVTKILKYLSLINLRESHLFDRISYTVRYYHLCSVFLTDSNVFDEEIQAEMRCNFDYILQNKEKVDLSIKVARKKSFYDLYTELITQYAGVSYGMHIFAEFVLFPLQNRFDVSLKKLLWFEYLHVLKVITIPYPAAHFMDVEDFVEPYEMDESLMVAYLNSVSSGEISKQKNPFVYHLAISNINSFMRNAPTDTTLYNFLSRRIRLTISAKLKQDLSSW